MSGILNCSVAIAASILMCSCGSAAEDDRTHSTRETQGSHSDDWRWMVSPQPIDLSTDVGESPIALLVRSRWGDQRPTAAVLESLSRHVKLVDASERAVPFEFELVLPDPRTPTNAEEADADQLEIVSHLLIVPKDALAHEWHTLRGLDLPAEFRVTGYEESGIALPASSFRVRFAPQSLPIYQAIVLCAPKDKALSVLITVSQPATPADIKSENIQLRGNNSACQITNAVQDQSARMIHLMCDTSGPFAEAVLAVSGRISSLDGQPITMLDGRDNFEIRWPGKEWYEFDPGCFSYLQ